MMCCLLTMIQRPAWTRLRVAIDLVGGRGGAAALRQRGAGHTGCAFGGEGAGPGCDAVAAVPGGFAGRY